MLNHGRYCLVMVHNVELFSIRGDDISIHKQLEEARSRLWLAPSQCPWQLMVDPEPVEPYGSNQWSSECFNW